MKIIVALNDLGESKKFLQYIRPNVDVTIFLEEVDSKNYVNANEQRYPIFPTKILGEYIFNNSWDYLITAGQANLKFFIDAGIDSARVIDVETILNDKYFQRALFFAGVQKNIAEYKCVVVGGLSSLMDFDVEKFPIKTISLATQDQDLWLSYRYLEKILSTPNHQIKYVFIGFLPHTLRWDLSSSSNKWDMLSHYPIFKETHNLPISKNVIESLFNENFLNAYDSLIDADNNIFSGINFADPLNERQDNDGTITDKDLYGLRAEIRRWASDKYLPTSKENSQIFMNFLELCKRNNVKPVVAKLPVHGMCKIAMSSELTNELHFLTESAKKEYYFESLDLSNKNMIDNREFCRPNVLNTVGASRLNSQIHIIIQKLENKKIRVGFLMNVRLDKLRAVYEVMIQGGNNSRFDVYLLMTPNLNQADFQAHRTFDDEFKNYVKKQYFSEKIYKDKPNTTLVKIYYEKGGVDISSLKLDYLFYYRPYVNTIPMNVSSHVVQHFLKTCYIPYGVSFCESAFDFLLQNSLFFNSMNFFFADAEDFADFATKAYHTNGENSDQKFVCLGSSEMEFWCTSYAERFEENLNKPRKSILWTPRWTYDKRNFGGSHFIEYKDLFTNLRRKYPDVALNVRPHPNLFQEMIDTKLMTAEEVEQYKQSLKDNDIYLDKRIDLSPVVNQSDIMISDISSIIPLLMMTGNPVIYCACDQVLAGTMKVTEPGLYIANNWEEVEGYVAMLLAGKDPLKDKRREVFKKMYSLHVGATNRIVQAIIDDYDSTHKND